MPTRCVSDGCALRNLLKPDVVCLMSVLLNRLAESVVTKNETSLPSRSVSHVCAVPDSRVMCSLVQW